ncbi:hypothetical protein EU546_04570 [Candidatus Thorarchaeota archaeon]|nr:MAG: hypothetical protein EU546_04570 [Candidatus Thorarchaeota archaeon]
MKNIRMAIAVLGLLALVLAFQPVVVDAHSPAGVDLEYNSSTDELTVTVDHIVSNVNTHYM